MGASTRSRRVRAAASTIAVLALFAGCTAPGGEVERSGLVPDGLLPDVSRALSVVVDPTRWSGEPSILALADGTLLVTGAGGMTRYVEDPTDIPGNFGSSYLWRSVDDGATWQFVDLGLPAPAGPLLPYRNAILGVEGDLAGDEAGRAYFVDLTMLAIDGVAASDDAGATWTAAQNPAVGLPLADRPWLAAIGDGVVYMTYTQLPTGIRATRSNDGGLTWLEDVEVGAWARVPVADLAAREIVMAGSQGSTLYMFRTGAEGPMDWERVEMFDVEGRAEPISSTVAVAGARQYVFAWAEHHDEGAVVRVAASLDGGETWSEPRNVSAPGRTAVFPWVDANADGTVGLVWYEADMAGQSDAIDAAWLPLHAQLRLAPDGLFLGEVTALADEPIHRGPICMDGLGCVLDGRAEDRRLLDFFEIDVDAAGRSHVTWTNTQTDVPTVWYGRVS